MSRYKQTVKQHTLTSLRHCVECSFMNIQVNYKNLLARLLSPKSIDISRKEMHNKNAKVDECI